MSSAPGTAFYVTTPIYYVNDAPHIGHAYTTVAADVLARWHRQRGERTWFLTGTDEHGQKVMRTAEANGVTPQQWCDDLVAGSWRPVLDTLNISNDDFIRTTDERHTRRVQEFWQSLHDAGHVYRGSYEGPYCVGCEEFKVEDELLPDPEGGTDESGKPVKLCPIHSRPVEWLAESNYFFKMSEYGDRLLAFYEDNPDFIQPASARNEVLAFVRGGLKDLSISRSSFDWGIPIPWDDEHVLYVWIDALLNYVSALGGPGTEANPADPLFAEFWPADVHLVGKDILRFHAVIWPAMLMAAGLPVPRKVFAHGWLLVGGEKMSKSKLTGIAPEQITDHFGVDAFRWYFLRAIAFGQDGSFSWEDMSARYTSELANGLGNLASRVAAMVGKYCDGVLPEPTEPGPAEAVVSTALARAVEEADAAMVDLRFHDGLAAMYEFVTVINGYLTEQEPWKVAKGYESDDEQVVRDAKARVETVLYTAAEALRGLAVLLNPVMPATAESLWSSLGAEPRLGALADQQVGDAMVWGLLRPGATVTKGAAMFPRLEDPAPA
jgi:methionyl-tRNA synthetase